MKHLLRSWLWRVPIDQEVDEELTFHIEMRTRELVAGGMDPKRARDLAVRRLGDLANLKRTCADLGRKRDREMRLAQWIEELRDDVTFAVRQLRAAPAFTLVAAITLALGIGANSAMFALVDAVLLRPLPLPAADRLVMMWERGEKEQRGRVAPLNMLDWNDKNRTFEQIAGYVPGVGGMVMAGADGTAETVPRQWVTRGVFDVFGIKPVAGRTFLPSDEPLQTNGASNQPRPPGAVVLSEEFWQTRFGGDRTVIGRVLRLDGMPFTLVGVVPKEAQLIGQTSMWALLPLNRNPRLRAPRMLQVVGRMKPGVSLAAASSDMAAIGDALAREFPQTNKGRTIQLEPTRDFLIGGELRLTSMLFLGVVGFVLLICCANVANLQLARSTVRARELAVRSALGAGRRRVIRQLLTESLVLAAVGGALAVAVGAAILRMAPALIPNGLLPGAVTLDFDMRVVAFCAAAAFLVGLLFGLAPAWQATAFSSSQVLASGSRTATGRGSKVRGLLVTAEVAAATLLLCGAGLLLRTLLAVQHVDRGYRADSVLTMMVDPLGSQYPTPESLQQFYGAVEQEVLAVPGVQSVAWASTLPMGASGFGRISFEIAGDPPLDESKRPSADYQIVSPSYFRTIDLPIVTGRAFSDLDAAKTTRVCIVNEALVRRLLQGRSPIGVRIAIRPTEVTDAAPIMRDIVGVARQVKERPDEVEDMIQVYVPMAQAPLDDIYIVVRPKSGSAQPLASPVRAAIGRVDKDQLVSVRDIITLEDIAWQATGRHRFRAVMVMTFAGLALLLAMIGVFGLLAYTVQQRVREFGVRMALGASLADVLRVVVGSSARLVSAGVVMGLGAAALLTRWLTTVLFGVQPIDPLTFAAVTIVLAFTAIAATAAPAWRAARVDPANALRSE